jgi:hypothetical protein
MEVDWAFNLLCSHYIEEVGIVEHRVYWCRTIIVTLTVVMRRQWLVNRKSGDLFRS